MTSSSIGHFPASHPPLTQARPHAPQFFESVSVFTPTQSGAAAASASASLSGGGAASSPPPPSFCATAAGPSWYYDDPMAPTRIFLCPSACATVTADTKAKLDIQIGCTSREPPVM